jgi:ADP-ribose pyrophosphatase YjhB (NUDIX family)
MTTIEQPLLSRGVHSCPAPPRPGTVVSPAVYVAVRWLGGRLLLVRRSPEEVWELPGGCVRVGETAIAAAVRTTAQQAGVQVLITGIAGLFTAPGHLIRAPDGELRQQFAVLLHARAVGGVPHADLRETSRAEWVAVGDISSLAMESSARVRVATAIAVGDPPYLD